ncbi:hypothetical protein Tco_0666249, partial [Tanacetum coccineum]
MALVLQTPTSAAAAANNKPNSTITILHNPFIYTTTSFNLRSISATKIKHRFRIRASATLESSNGAAVTLSVPSPAGADIPYGRQYFPLAAVIGQ